MTSDEIIAFLKEHAETLRRDHGVEEMHVFGSVARGEETEGSDVDVLVKLREPVTFRGYMGLKFFLEDGLGRNVDLLTDHAMKPALRPFVERDALRVA